MHPWQDDRRRFAAIDEQNRLNEELAEADRSAKPRGGLGYLLFLGAVIFFKPFAEYCIELYGFVTSYLHGLPGMFGF
ncbi:hypothetical protein [Rhizobium sp. Root483D2]|uniref:hypothetical protein n=1 Tax=Rhizobium sp. Root483D2 TaxID=1736545 RepID=UPI000715C697|nr:hypothetical protein [Rhizobium sp. Root483D2]KQY48533.1 hypothetical protein ASD32_09040 [Rhizobium sp. Root483D2]